MAGNGYGGSEEVFQGGVQWSLTFRSAQKQHQQLDLRVNSFVDGVFSTIHVTATNFEAGGLSTGILELHDTLLDGLFESLEGVFFLLWIEDSSGVEFMRLEQFRLDQPIEAASFVRQKGVSFHYDLRLLQKRSFHTQSSPDIHPSLIQYSFGLWMCLEFLHEPITRAEALHGILLGDSCKSLHQVEVCQHVITESSQVADFGYQHHCFALPRHLAFEQGLLQVSHSKSVALLVVLCIADCALGGLESFGRVLGEVYVIDDVSSVVVASEDCGPHYFFVDVLGGFQITCFGLLVQLIQVL